MVDVSLLTTTEYGNLRYLALVYMEEKDSAELAFGRANRRERALGATALRRALPPRGSGPS